MMEDSTNHLEDGGDNDSILNQCTPPATADSNNDPVMNNEDMTQRTLDEWDKSRKTLERMLGLNAFRPGGAFLPAPPLLAAALQHPLAFTNSAAFNAMAANAQGATINGGHLGMDHLQQSPIDTEPEDLSVKLNGKCSSMSPEEGTIDGLLMAEGNNGNQQSWSYEEQFKQLYELSDDTKRKAWLDDWLGFMHKIGKPVTRIPIMAKQVLDLYELYRLVVSHGGLVEIIKKKLWREITKGLNLPSSITSAAFTLRTQYQKYLYDYECDRENMSSPNELQKAIDENRREGRRQGGSYSPFQVAPTMMKNDDDMGDNSMANKNNALAVFREQQLAAMETQRQIERVQRAALDALQKQQQQQHCHLGTNNNHNNNNNNSSNNPNGGRASTSSHDSDGNQSCDLNTEPSAKRMHLNGLGALGHQMNSLNNIFAAANNGNQQNINQNGGLSDHSIMGNHNNINNNGSNPIGNLPHNMNALNSNLANAAAPTPQQLAAALGGMFGGMSNAHIKLTSRGDGSYSSNENSLVVSMEINGIMYQGVLFALNSAPNSASQNGPPTTNVRTPGNNEWDSAAKAEDTTSQNPGSNSSLSATGPPLTDPLRINTESDE